MQDLTDVPLQGCVTIVILTWNGLSYTRRCIESLQQTNGVDYRVVVVDNGSTDGTLEYLRTQPGINVIANKSNLGFAKGTNQAIRAADPSTDVVLLNNDTEILQADWLVRLRESAYRARDIGVVGCRLIRPDRKLQHTGTYLPLDTFWGQQVAAGETDVNQYNEDRDVEGVVFACVYLKAEVLRELGPLKEEYENYFEDTDYCLTAVEHGYRVVCCGSVTVLHHENVSTTVNQVSRRHMFLKAQKVFRSEWGQKLKENRYQYKLGWHSIFNGPTGYAISSREMARALDRRKVHLAYRYVYGPGTSIPREEPQDAGDYLLEMLRRRKLNADRPQVVYAQGDLFESNFGRYKIGFTMLETDRIPQEWVRQSNLMDEVWVPSTFNARTFRQSGVIRPIHVIPLGVDTDHFNPRIRRHELGVFVFLSIFEWGARKAPELLLRAFNQEFGAAEPVMLLCKVINTDAAVNVRQAVADCGLRPGGGRIHISLNQVIPAHELGMVYRSADCFVLTTRGEGWGMPVMEAMACGLPVIATDWSAHRDFMNAGNAYPLPVDTLVAADAKCPYYQGFKWAQPSHDHLRRLMRHVYENREEARARGAAAAACVKENWTWDHTSRKIVERLAQIGQGS